VAADRQAEPLFVVDATESNLSLDVRGLWDYRELLYFLAWRDITVRYKQTALGIGWAVIQPLLTMVAFTIFFGYLGRIPSNGIPYAIFAYTALLPWQLFAYSLTTAGSSLIVNSHLLTKVFFPRLLVPLAAIAVGLADFAISGVVLAGMIFYYHIPLTWNLVYLPFLIIFAVATALAAALWLAPLSVRFRDIQVLIPFLAQFWLFITPVAYPANLVPQPWRWLYALNPMVGVIEGFRMALLGQTQPVGPLILVGAVVTCALLLGGVAYFKRTEATFADII
jgi:lipopolysaccharide transport system permease protein